ncbi:MAG: tripartite tricarboxylate transporter permease [Firmicutes bacterium]|nr:tripartite tricarboxylate transporter permease [Bacillota bacterium]
METLHYLTLGFRQALTPVNLLWLGAGGLLGTIVGMLPGLGPATGVAVLIPITYGMNPTTALITMAAIYYGAMFGGSRSSIMLNIPGCSSAIATCFDGYPMTQNGEAGKALATSAIASFVGGTISTVMTVFLTLPVANAALKFGPAEMFSVMLFALTATVALSQGSIVKGFVSMSIGFMLSTIGIDAQTGLRRFTLGIGELLDGVDFLVVMIGLYAVAEVFRNYAAVDRKYQISTRSIGRVVMTREDLKKSIMPMLRNSPLGFVVGVLPGMGGSIATMMAYALEKQLSKHPERFGRGAIEGVAAPEAANNAASSGAMVPLLTMGIPGSGTTAVMLGALMMLGVRPGPLLFQQHPEIAWGVIASMILGNLILLVINLPLVVPLVKLLNIPQRILMPIILGLAFTGTYPINYSTFDFLLLSLFGLVGYAMSKLDIPIPPLVLALILGSNTEQSLRRALTISNGNPMTFFEKPISFAFIILAVLSLVYSFMREAKSRRARAAAA